MVYMRVIFDKLEKSLILSLHPAKGYKLWSFNDCGAAA